MEKNKLNIYLDTLHIKKEIKNLPSEKTIQSYIKDYKLIKKKESNLSYSERQGVIKIIHLWLKQGIISSEDLE